MIEAVGLHRDAPAKPARGQPCNGCGICCAIERCPQALLLLPREGGVCPALEWHADAQNYRCGLVLRPAHHVRWLPKRWEGAAGRWLATRIAAGSG